MLWRYRSYFALGFAISLLAIATVADARQETPATANPVSPPAPVQPRPERPTTIISLATPSKSVGSLLFDGDSAMVSIMWEHKKTCFTQGRELFNKGLREAIKRRESKSETAARTLVTLADKAIVRYDTAAATAKRDVASGRLCYKISGMISPSFDERKALLNRKYGVEIVRVADCDVNYEELAEEEGYNSVSLAAIKRKFGTVAADAIKGI